MRHLDRKWFQGQPSMKSLPLVSYYMLGETREKKGVNKGQPSIAVLYRCSDTMLRTPPILVSL